MREKSLEEKLVRGVKKKGGLCVKFVSPGNKGVPDRIVIFPHGVIWFVEMKAPGKSLRKDQDIWKSKLTDYGCGYTLIDGEESLLDFLKSVGGIGDGI